MTPERPVFTPMLEPACDRTRTPKTAAASDGWRTLGIAGVLFLAAVSLRPDGAMADAALHDALFGQLEMAISNDPMPELRSFERRPFDGLLPSAPDSAETGSSWWRDYVLQQLPPDVAELPPSQTVGLLTLERCGPLLSSYGIAERRDLGFDYGDIDRIRVTLALAAAGLDADVPPADMNALRDGDDRRALRRLNTSLYRQYADGRTEVPHMVLDLAEGCGSEIPALVTIRPPGKLHAVHVIPEFYFAVCERRYADPWDPTLCPWWDSAPEQLMASGFYRWQGRLRSGEIRTGRVEFYFDGVFDWDTGNRREIVLR